MPESGSGPGRVLVTGASGFIGGHVTRYFIRQGLKVTGLIREKSNTDFIEDLPVTLFCGDIADPASLDAAFEGIDVVVHTAGKAEDWGDYEDFFRVNVEGTMNVLSTAVKHSIRRVIITGSVSSYGEEHHPAKKNETSPYHAHYPYFLDRWFPSGMNHYRDTKALCTQKAEAFAKAHPLDVFVIEPVWVYGENEFSSGFYEYLASVRSLPLMPGCGANNYHVVYAGDLARAYYLACTSPLKGFHRFIIGNREPENMQLIFSIFCTEAGLKHPVLLPKILTAPIGFVLELLYTLARSKHPPLLTRGRVNMFYDSINYDTAKARANLGFEAATPLAEGISKTVKWYKEHHHI